MDGRRSSKDRRLRSLTKCVECGMKFKNPQALKSHESVHKSGTMIKMGQRMKSKPIIIKRKTHVKKVKKTTKVEFECPKCTQIFSDYFTSFRHIQDYHCINGKGEEVLPTSPHIIRPKRLLTCLLCMDRILTEPHVCSEVVKQDVKLNKKDETKTKFICMGCDQTFSTVQLFDSHIPGSHGDAVESMFFPNLEEFTVWKQQMETHSKVKYVILNKKSLKQIYHCSFAPIHNSEMVTHFCPSSIILQEFPKGVQVHFHKEHHGHTVKEYNLPDQFKKCSLTTLMKNAENYTDITTENTDDSDLYIQFKRLMDCIVLDAAKINITTLKLLLGKALEMTSVLNNYDEDEEHSETILTLTKNKMTDDQISTALENIQNPQRNKRKVKIQLEIENKKPKMDTDHLELENMKAKAIEIENKKAKALEIEIMKAKALEIEKKTIKAIEMENKKAMMLEIENKKAKILEMENKKAKVLEMENKKAKILETELNKKAKTLEIETKKAKDPLQLDIEKETTIKYTSELENDNKKAKADAVEVPSLKENVLKKGVKQYPGKKVVDDKQDFVASTPKLKSKPLSLDSSPSSFNDSYKNFVDSNFKLNAENKPSRKRNLVSNNEIKHLITPTIISGKRKTVVKTKMGQFKPSISPKSPESKKDTPKIKEPVIKPRRTFGIVKDIEYEVMEQENDCNILILKI